jgi:hypothetical protein
MAPHPHQLCLVEVQPRNPAAIRFSQAARRNQRMQMRIEVQTATEGVRHHHNESPNTVPDFQILLYNCASEGGQIVEKMAILLKDRP